MERESHGQFGVGVEVFPVFFLALTVALARTASMLAWIKVEGDQSVSGADCAMAWVFVFVAPVPASHSWRLTWWASSVVLTHCSTQVLTLRLFL